MEVKANAGIAKRVWLAVAIVLAVLIVDQVIKIWVKTHMTLHEQIEVLSWFKIVFIENNGMAYGMELGSKLVLSLFRVVAVGLLGYYIWQQAKKQARWGYIVCLSMVLAGAAGNIFDSAFYGLIFNASSEYYTSYFVPFGTGYAPFLMGKVVDMFYFPIITTTWPEWVPVWRTALHLLQSHLQLCRLLHLGRCRAAFALLPEGDQRDITEKGNPSR